MGDADRPYALQPEHTLQSLPNARLVSNILSGEWTRSDVMERYPLNGLHVMFSEFLSHDFGYTPVGGVSWPICVPDGDKHFPSGYCIPFFRSATTNVTRFPGVINAATPVLDASGLYGDSEERLAEVRDGSSCFLRTSHSYASAGSASFLPPLNIGGKEMENGGPGGLLVSELFLTGDVRGNESPTLIALYSLFIREHNRLCRELGQQRKDLGDEDLFRKARQLLIATLQHITYNEHLTALTGAPLPSYRGYRPDQDPRTDLFFATVSFRYWHSQVRDYVTFLHEGEGDSYKNTTVPLAACYYYPPCVLQNGADEAMVGAHFSAVHAADVHYSDAVRAFRPFPPPTQPPIVDLFATDLQRARDHRIPLYNTMRSYYGLSTVSSWPQLTPDLDLQMRLARAYPAGPDTLEAIVGGLAEPHVPGGSVGPLFAHVIRDQYQRARDGDPFYFQNGQLAGLTSEEIDRVLGTKLAHVILRNTELSNLSCSAFYKMPGNDCGQRLQLQEEESGFFTVHITGSDDGLYVHFTAKADVTALRRVTAGDIGTIHDMWFAVGFSARPGLMAQSQLVLVAHPSLRWETATSPSAPENSGTKAPPATSHGDSAMRLQEMHIGSEQNIGCPEGVCPRTGPPLHRGGEVMVTEAVYEVRFSLSMETLSKLAGQSAAELQIITALGGSTADKLPRYHGAFKEAIFISLPPVQSEAVTSKLYVGLWTVLVLLGISLVLALAYLYRRTNELNMANKNTRQAILDSEEARAATAAKTRFLAQMSHELRTPMNGVLGMAEVLLESDHLSHEDKEMLEDVKASGRHMVAIVNELLDLSKIEQGVMQLECLPVDIRALIDSVVLLCPAPQTGVELVALVDPDVPDIIMGDPTRITQLCVNLASNSIKFTSGPGYVTLHVQIDYVRYPPMLVVELEDSGIGIPAASVNTIFQDFKQVSIETTRLYGGTGLGLSIVKKLSEMMGGTAYVTFAKQEDKSAFIHPILIPRTRSQSIAHLSQSSCTSLLHLHRGAGLLSVGDGHGANNLRFAWLRQLVGRRGDRIPPVPPLTVAADLEEGNLQSSKLLGGAKGGDVLTEALQETEELEELKFENQAVRLAPLTHPKAAEEGEEVDAPSTGPLRKVNLGRGVSFSSNSKSEPSQHEVPGAGLMRRNGSHESPSSTSSPESTNRHLASTFPDQLVTGLSRPHGTSLRFEILLTVGEAKDSSHLLQNKKLPVKHGDVLVVESHPHTRRALRLNLKRWGYRVHALACPSQLRACLTKLDKRKEPLVAALLEYRPSADDPRPSYSEERTSPRHRRGFSTSYSESHVNTQTAAASGQVASPTPTPPLPTRFVSHSQSQIPPITLTPPLAPQHHSSFSRNSDSNNSSVENSSNNKRNNGRDSAHHSPTASVSSVVVPPTPGGPSGLERVTQSPNINNTSLNNTSSLIPLRGRRSLRCMLQCLSGRVGGLDTDVLVTCSLQSAKALNESLQAFKQIGLSPPNHSQYALNESLQAFKQIGLSPPTILKKPIIFSSLRRFLCATSPSSRSRSLEPGTSPYYNADSATTGGVLMIGLDRESFESKNDGSAHRFSLSRERIPPGSRRRNSDLSVSPPHVLTSCSTPTAAPRRGSCGGYNRNSHPFYPPSPELAFTSLSINPSSTSLSEQARMSLRHTHTISAPSSPSHGRNSIERRGAFLDPIHQYGKDIPGSSETVFQPSLKRAQTSPFLYHTKEHEGARLAPPLPTSSEHDDEKEAFRPRVVDEPRSISVSLKPAQLPQLPEQTQTQPAADARGNAPRKENADFTPYIDTRFSQPHRSEETDLSPRLAKWHSPESFQRRFKQKDRDEPQHPEQLSPSHRRAMSTTDLTSGSNKRLLVGSAPHSWRSLSMSERYRSERGGESGSHLSRAGEAEPAGAVAVSPGRMGMLLVKDRQAEHKPSSGTGSSSSGSGGGSGSGSVDSSRSGSNSSSGSSSGSSSSSSSSGSSSTNVSVPPSPHLTTLRALQSESSASPSKPALEMAGADRSTSSTADSVSVGRPTLERAGSLMAISPISQAGTPSVNISQEGTPSVNMSVSQASLAETNTPESNASNHSRWATPLFLGRSVLPSEPSTPAMVVRPLLGLRSPQMTDRSPMTTPSLVSQTLASRTATSPLGQAQRGLAGLPLYGVSEEAKQMRGSPSLVPHLRSPAGRTVPRTGPSSARKRGKAQSKKENFALQHPAYILVVDDNLINRRVIVKMLTSLGYRKEHVEEASHGQEAVDKFRGCRLDGSSFSMVLMDRHMPIMDGVEASAKILEACKEAQMTPPNIIALTAAVMEAERAQCYEAGMVDFASKPVSLARLRELISTWCIRTTPATSPAPSAPVSIRATPSTTYTHISTTSSSSKTKQNNRPDA
eukprot:g2897.t1